MSEMMHEAIQNKHIKIETGPDYRMVVISDIHGHEEVFQELLDKVSLKEEDYLVILGDFVNRGPENMAVLKVIMNIVKRPRTYILKGNHESFITNSVKSKEALSEMISFLKKDPYVLILHDMAKLMDFDLYSCEDPEVFRQKLLQNFKNEIDFMDNRPVILENESFIFVHGGYENGICPEKDEHKLLKYDFYNDYGPVQEKRVIVGHWPTSNLRTDKMSNLPYFNNEKQIITIDGGLGVKSSGELNAFIITSKEGHISYDNLQSNTFSEKVISSSMKLPEEELVFVNYPHFDIEILERSQLFTQCVHTHTGKTFSVFNSLLYKEEGKDYITTNYINRFFNISKGDTVQVCQAFEDCVQVKYKDEFGWVLPVQLERGL